MGNARTALLRYGLATFILIAPGFGQTSQTVQPVAPAPADAAKGSAYFNFAMGHLYAEMAGAYQNRAEYVNKAIDYYKEASRLDPSATYVSEELSELYIQAGQLQKAVAEVEDLLKRNPDNLNARKILARVYSRRIGDPQQGKVDPAMLKSAIEQYQKITQQDPKDAESLSMLARLYRVSHDDASAEKTYRAILALDQNNDDALGGLAMVFADKGDIPGAISMLKQAVDRDPNPRTVVALAEFYDQNHDYSLGADTWKMALPLTNDNARVRRAYAQDLLASNRWDEALKAYQELAKDEPKDAQLQLSVAEIFRQKHNFAQARVALEKARMIENGPEVRYEEVNLLDSEGKTGEAVTALQGLLAETKKPQYTDPEKAARLRLLERLGQLDRDSNKTADAVAAYRQIADIDPALAPRVELMVIDTYRNARDYKTAKQLSDSSIRKYPTDRALALMHSSVLADMGQADAAVKELNALPNADKDREVLLSIAQIYDKAKRFDEERAVLDRAETAAASDQEKQAVFFSRGAMFERMKNFDGAEKEFRKVLATDPNNAGAMNYLGYMLADRSVRLDEAQQLISKALDLDPDNPAYLDSLGWVYFRQNRLDQAVGELRRSLEKINKDPTVHDHLGDVYFKQGKLREAIQQWEASVSEYKAAAPSDQDPAEMSKVSRKLENAKVKVAEKIR